MGSDVSTGLTTQVVKMAVTHNGNFHNVLPKSQLRVQPHLEVTHDADGLDGVGTNGE
jgi:hypothetical protein